MKNYVDIHECIVFISLHKKRKKDKTVFLTTHNPLVLDGLDLTNDRIRLFTVSRDSYGYARIDRVLVGKELLNKGKSLSRLWIEGDIGGVPELL